MSKGIRVRIISRKMARSKQDRKNLDALNKINNHESEKGEVRYCNYLHARLLYNDNSTLISSADMKSDSLGGTLVNAGIYSNSPIIKESVERFFNELWDDSDDNPHED